MKPARSFKDMRVWQEAYKLCLCIYEITADFPKTEQFGLTSQMRRAAVSVCSNIAEGFGRKSYKEKDKFYSISYGSLLELECQLDISKGIQALNQSSYGQCIEILNQTAKMLYSLKNVNKEKGYKI